MGNGANIFQTITIYTYIVKLIFLYKLPSSLVVISSRHIPRSPDASSQSFPCAKALSQQEQLMTSMEKLLLLSKHKDLAMHQT